MNSSVHICGCFFREDSWKWNPWVITKKFSFFSEYCQIAPQNISTNLHWLAVYKSTYSLIPLLALDIFQVLHFYHLEKVALRGRYNLHISMYFLVCALPAFILNLFFFWIVPCVYLN